MSDIDFAKLSDRDHVRLRPGMYIGDCGISGLHHLAGELINNSLDEVQLCQATGFTVQIHQDESLSVEDDGRGISIATHAEESERQGREVSVLEAVMTKFGPGKKGQMRRTFGIGLKAVNFLIRSCLATVWRDGFEYQLRFAQGERVGDLQQIGSTTKHGTRITFQADAEIFEYQPKFDYDRLQTRLRELAYLHPNLITRIHDERTKDFHFERGISQFVEELTRGRQVANWYWRWPLHTDVMRLEIESPGAQLEIALQFTSAERELIQTYVNDELLPDGGTPVIGLRKGITRAIHNYAKKHDLKGDVVPTGEDLRSGLTAVIVACVAEPQFAAATRHKIENPELAPLTESAVYEFLQKHFVANSETASRIWQQGVAAAERRTKEEQYMSK